MTAIHTRTCRLALLLSGTGSTMVNLHSNIVEGKLPAEIAVVVSSRKNVLGLERAEERSIKTEVLTRKPFKKGGTFDSDAYSNALVEILERFEVDLVVMAGFMTRLTSPVLERFDVVNVHPALLPMFGGRGFYGHHVHEAVLEAGVKITGATVHFADSQYDHGPIIMQEAVPVLENDTPDTLADRVQAAERRIYPKAIALYAEGRLMREKGRVRVS
ncbi:MAG: phosphoribosylglycinamide formyltransferase [Deltaproteobacteria bacterium]|nr:phosphoribosylglycinamide formyltransferase [Deltaproteobacteria bacterium]